MPEIYEYDLKNEAKMGWHTASAKKWKIAPRVSESYEIKVLGGPGGFKNGSKKQVEKLYHF